MGSVLDLASGREEKEAEAPEACQERGGRLGNDEGFLGLRLSGLSGRRVGGSRGLLFSEVSKRAVGIVCNMIMDHRMPVTKSTPLAILPRQPYS